MSAGQEDQPGVASHLCRVDDAAPGPHLPDWDERPPRDWIERSRLVRERTLAYRDETGRCVVCAEPPPVRKFDSSMRYEHYEIVRHTEDDFGDRRTVNGTVHVLCPSCLDIFTDLVRRGPAKWWLYSKHQIDVPWWQLFYRGGDEWGRPTVVVRFPGGWLCVAFGKTEAYRINGIL